MSADPYERLAQLAEAELGLCEEGRVEEMGALYARAAAIAAVLPPRPPAAAAAALSRAAAAQEKIARRLGVAIVEAQGDLHHLHRGRDAARSYAATAEALTRR